MHILIAPNAFKNSLTAIIAAQAIKTGIEQSRLTCSTECFPIGDGGDGTMALIIQKCDGIYVPITVTDPLGRSIRTSYGLIDNGETAIIEMADASGLRLLQPAELNPLRATSFGTGEMMQHAMLKGVKKIIIGMGGSATVDAGAGILQALGVDFLNVNGHPLSGSPSDLINLYDVDLSGLDNHFTGIEIVVLCDVNNVLLGPNGAANIFGPQKGASEEDVQKLELSLAQFNEIAAAKTGIDLGAVKSGGTAGGAAAGLFAFLNAKLVNGIEYFLELTSFEHSLVKSDIVITGEGSIDEQTLDGKGPFGVASKAKQKQKHVIGIAGMIPAEINPNLQQVFDVLIAIGEKPSDLSSALLKTKDNLIRTGHVIGTLLSFTHSH